MITTAAKRKTIGQLLLEKNLVTQHVLDATLNHQKSEQAAGRHKLTGEILIEQGLITEEQLLETLAEIYGVPYAKVSPKICDPKVIEVLPREFVEKHVVLPMFLVRNTLTVALAEPSNLFLIEEIQQMTGYQVQVVASSQRDIANTMQAHLPAANVFVIDDIIDEVRPEDLTVVESQVEDITNLQEVAGHSPVIKLVNYLIYNAVREGASDIHIEPDEKKTRVRFRVDGKLYEKLTPPHQMHPAVISRLKIMAALDISERRLPQDGGIHVLLEGRPIDLRVSTMPEKWGEKAVVRIIDNRNIPVNLEKLGFAYEMMTSFKKILEQPNGILLVTGPTGSGKSTTLYAALHELHKPDINICTVEDPVEFNLPGVNQFQTNDKIGFTFASALRSLLRQDPDVIMVGEVRDADTARIAIQAALTGHLVLSTLHTNDAPSSIIRLINMGVEPYLIAASLRGIVAQRLVRKLCPACREAYEPPLNIRHIVEKSSGPVDNLYRPKGCKKCRNTGFSGRIGIYEFLAPDPEMLDAVVAGATIQKLRDMCKARNIGTLRADGLVKVKAGITSYEEILRATAL
ncbi:MAG TPA: ATPase, T2SS/T4P/T4SS family [Phycisphaerae bacterium]|nr:ATPase, T2SS/T4P/T4SS family [Phycisphaerae bacterium]